QDVADPFLESRAIPRALIVEDRFQERVVELLDLLVAERVALVRPTRTARAARTPGFAHLPIVRRPRAQPVELTRQQVDLLEVAPLLFLLHDKPNQLRFHRQRDAIDRLGVVPSIAPLPAVQRGRLLAEHFGNPSNSIAL